MATIDLIVLGMLKTKALSAYDIQKQVEYRNISRWVKISTPSIYKKVIQLEEKGLIKGTATKEGNMAEKAVYSLTPTGEAEFEKLMLDISAKPINILLDFNAVIVNLMSLPPDEQILCLDRIEDNIHSLKQQIEKNISEKNDMPEIPEMGMVVLRQQFMLVQAIADWIKELKGNFDN